MLRLTKAAQNGSAMTLRVEGRIVGEWAAFLERECAALVQDSRPVYLDLSDVTYIDTIGVGMLNRLAPGRFTITNCPPLIRELLGGEGL
jgi:anti-anti-sigma regulatory factor